MFDGAAFGNVGFYCLIKRGCYCLLLFGHHFAKCSSIICLGFVRFGAHASVFAVAAVDFLTITHLNIGSILCMSR